MARNLLMDDVDICVTTCYGANSSLLMKVDVGVSHLIVDECAQIVESEMLIALNLLRDKRSDGPVQRRAIANTGNALIFRVRRDGVGAEHRLVPG